MEGRNRGPAAKRLTEESQEEMTIETKDDVARYLACVAKPKEILQYCKINDAVKNKIIDFEFWPHLIDLWWALESNRQVIVLKARQEGISYLLCFYMLSKVLTVRGFNALVVSAGEREASRFLEKCKFAYTQFPLWLRLPVGKWSESEITFPSMGSRIAAYPSTENPTLGETASLRFDDEWEYHSYPDADYAAGEPTTSAGGQHIGASTVDKSKPDSLFKSLYRQGKNGENNYRPVFIGALARPDRDMGWYEQEKLNYIGRMWQFDQNHPLTEEQALSPVSGKAFFDTDRLQVMLETSTPPMEERYGCTHIYSKFQPTWVYACGADVSQGVERDYQALTMLGKKGNTVEDVAYIHVNDMASKTYAFYSNELGKEYNFPLLGAEANSMGLGYLQELSEQGYLRLFFRDGKKEKLGWWTNKDRREMALIDLANALADGLLVIRFKPLISQLLEFQRIEGRSGEIEYKSVGKHDDLVMSLAIAYQMIKNVKPRGNPIKDYTLVEETTTMGMYKT